MNDLLAEFSDVTPVKQDDGPVPVVRINYASDFVEVMDYFRAVLLTQELSERTLKLTERVIELNSANYTCWQFRRQCLAELRPGRLLQDELNYTRNIALESPKNYQVWYHRRVLVDRLAKALESEEKETDNVENRNKAPSIDLTQLLRAEKDHVDEILKLDHKNYHAWSHRHWLLRTFKCWDGELSYVDTHLKSDIRNNSAWSHRFWVVEQSEGWSKEPIKREMGYTFHQIQLCAGNESAWNYLLGLLMLDNFDGWAECKDFSEGIIKLLKKGSGALQEFAPAKGFLVELLKRHPDPADLGLYKQMAAALCEDLATVTDRIRKPYWSWMKTKIEEGISGQTAEA